MFKRGVVLALAAVAVGYGQSPADARQEIIDNLQQAGFPRSEIQVFDGKVYTGLDAEVTLEASREMLAGDSTTEEQYRTTNLVGTSVTNICVDGSNFSGDAKFSAALDMAIENYNNEGLRWHMTRISGRTSGCSA